MKLSALAILILLFSSTLRSYSQCDNITLPNLPTPIQQMNSSTSQGDLKFSTSNGTSLNEAMRIDQDGLIGVSTATPNTYLDLNGDLAVRQGSLPLVNGNSNHNVSLGKYSFVRVTGPTAAFTITGFAGGVDGKIVTIYNSTTFNMTIANEITSTTTNRILTLTGANITTIGTGTVTLQYSSADSRWIVIAIRD